MRLNPITIHADRRICYRQEKKACIDAASCSMRFESGVRRRIMQRLQICPTTVNVLLALVGVEYAFETRVLQTNCVSDSDAPQIVVRNHKRNSRFVF